MLVGVSVYEMEYYIQLTASFLKTKNQIAIFPFKQLIEMNGMLILLFKIDSIHRVSYI